MGGSVLAYALSYMQDDPHPLRLASLLLLFVALMCVFVTAGNLLMLFFGWEGMGVVSYLLISFYVTRSRASTSALQALQLNRVGDAALLIAMLVVLSPCLPLDLESLAPCIGSNVKKTAVISSLVVVAAVAKSAQLGLHS